MSHIGVIGLLMFIAPVMYVHAQENRGCTEQSTPIDVWRAGVITEGSPLVLRLMFDSSDPSCGGTPCLVCGGVTGVELRRAGSSVCVGVPLKGKLPTSLGWIPASRWRTTDSSPKSPTLWAGVWQNEGAKITVQSMSNGQLDIQGHAIRVLSEDVAPIDGDFEITGKPENGIVKGSGDDAGCKVSARLLGDYLVVADNDACGGMGVSFTGMYRFRHR